MITEREPIFFLAVLQISDAQTLERAQRDRVVCAVTTRTNNMWRREKVLPFDALIAGFLSRLGAF